MTIAGPTLRFRKRTYRTLTCRDAVLDAVVVVEGTGRSEFTLAEIVREVQAAGTDYPAETIAKTVRRMSGHDRPQDHLELEATGNGTFRLARR